MTAEQLDKLKSLAERATCLLFTGIQPASADKNDLAVALSPDVVLELIAQVRSLGKTLQMADRLPSISEVDFLRAQVAQVKSEFEDFAKMMSESSEKVVAQLAEAREVIQTLCEAGTEDAEDSKGDPLPWDKILMYHADMKKARAYLEKYPK